ncbi:hypothetical protein LSH36_69g00004 [Paralvinella palmiformis]|uniref:Uncharacterized protein n=1 Tax=Paralvinella palmiformis TaxID=53620 RepID=A0AAD9NEB1_9ANNE|nr:hypothetical protein LSH36_69g00004 [Paralvinella palmiformis]
MKAHKKPAGVPLNYVDCGPCRIRPILVLAFQKAVRTNSRAVSSDMSDRWSHIACGTGISRTDYVSLIADNDFGWKCDPCCSVDLPLPPAGLILLRANVPPPPPGFAPLHATHVDNDLSVPLVAMDSLVYPLSPWTPTPPQPPAGLDLTLTQIPVSMDDFDDSMLDYPPPPRSDTV